VAELLGFVEKSGAGDTKRGYETLLANTDKRRKSAITFLLNPPFLEGGEHAEARALQDKLMAEMIHKAVLVQFALENAGENVDRGWRYGLLAVNGLRRWVFLPGLVGVIPTIVVIRGGDALSVCFNTVAVLFTLEIDNLAFKMLISERIRAYVEAAGHVELTEAQREALTVVKLTHMVLLFISAFIGLQLINFGMGGEFGVGFGMFILAGMIESVLTRDSPKDKLLGAVFAGVAGFSGMVFLIFVLAPW
jgi:hypothetical protein